MKVSRKTNSLSVDEKVKDLLFTLNKQQISKEELSQTHKEIKDLVGKTLNRNNPIPHFLMAGFLFRVNELSQALKEFSSSCNKKLSNYLKNSDNNITSLFFELTKTALEKKTKAVYFAAIKTMLRSNLLDISLLEAFVENELSNNSNILSILKSLGLGPSDAAYYVIYSLIKYRQNRFTEALYDIEQAIKLSSENDHLQLLLIRILIATGKDKDAITHIVPLLRYNHLSSRELFELYMLYADILIRNEKYTFLRDIFDSKTFKELNLAESEEVLAKIKIAESYLKEAWNSWEEESIKTAKKLLEEALKIDPTNPAIFKLLGFSYFFLYDIPNSIQFFEEYANLSNDHSWILDFAKSALDNTDTTDKITYPDFYSKYFNIYLDDISDKNSIEYYKAFLLWAKMDLLFGHYQAVINKLLPISEKIKLLKSKTFYQESQRLLLAAYLSIGNLSNIDGFIKTLSSDDSNLRLIALEYKTTHHIDLSADEIFELSSHYYIIEDYDAVIKILSPYRYGFFFKQDKFNDDLLIKMNILLAEAYFKIGFYTLGRILFKDILKRIDTSHPKYNELELKYAQCLLMNKDFEELKSIINNQPTLKYIELMIKENYVKHDYPTILALAKEYKDTFGFNKETHFLIADASFELKEYETALIHIENCIKQDPFNSMYIGLLRKIEEQLNGRLHFSSAIAYNKLNNIPAINEPGVVLFINTSEDTPYHIRAKNVLMEGYYPKITYPASLSQKLDSIVQQAYEAALYFLINKGFNMDNIHISLSFSSIEDKYIEAIGAAIAVAIVSSVMNIPVKNDVAVIGAINASGKLIKTPYVGRYIKNAVQKYHLKRMIIPLENVEIVALLEPEIILSSNIEFLDSLEALLNKILKPKGDKNEG